MKLFTAALAALALTHVVAPPAHAQLPEFEAFIDSLQDELGVKRFGSAKIADVDDGGTVTLTMKVDSTQVTYLQLACDGYCQGLAPTVTTRSGVALEPEMSNPVLPVIQVPAGSGDEIDIEVFMTCEYAYCTMGIQALTR